MTKLVSGQAIIQEFESWSKKKYAEEGDPIGLQVGSLNKKIKKVMTALDVLPNVVEEAVDEGVDLIIAHHPILYRPLKKINLDTAQGKMIETLIKHDITVYAAHTNLDVAPGGVNDMLAEALGLKDTSVLVETFQRELKKVVVFVPASHQEEVRNALANAGAGSIGEYSDCTFTSQGTGRFKPTDYAKPFIGEAGALEAVDEVKIESIFYADQQATIINAIKKAHPYEEVAYDIYPLDNEPEKLGLGRVGQLEKEMTLESFAGFVKEKLSAGGVRIVGDLQSTIKKVAVLGGDGNKFINAARFSGADVFVSGDIYYHVAHDAMIEGLQIIDAGHNIEKIMIEGVRKKLLAFLEEKRYETEIISSQEKTDPFQFR
ncbi:Nif3-like dinuclear metal center hexameric protein [Bacillus sp. N1-1]|jgi:dinuclear metal center YbgI/SA1388 family protein|uniref:Nif3-like dinuclear metal center hexameric protein n=1 Tax=Bacillus sp. N1-1 TaxID=2682541 RepID=UPI00131968F0|nr:Nif3-like dinuclear metal center hexameric protein [Bacillus sp. N1-1]QHA92618.1 Nif3-like dinuclear metal center hexameric protein [Bacillus sp. N1-1]